MNVTDIILKKRNGTTLDKEEIRYIIKGFTDGVIPDYQMSALLMAIWFKGMDREETTNLTMAMCNSGDRIDLTHIPGIKVDKHSTGGVADTTTLIIAPLVAACGGKVAKMSGRGLGHTGGTLDKLESIPSFSVNHSMETFTDIVNTCGLSVIGQTANLVPADKLLYALRDVTCTIDNVSLIAGSIMSKKIASGSDAIVLDVKVGNGAFMKDYASAEILAGSMVEIGHLTGRKTVALITDMNQPLGQAVGNALEVKEAIDVLKGECHGRLKDVSFALAAQMLLVSEICKTEEEALEKLEKTLDSGEGLNKFAQMIKAQGGNPDVVKDTDLLPSAKKRVSVKSDQSGFLHAISTSEIGISAMLLGAGRQKKDDIIDPAVGLWMKKGLGDPIKKGDTLAEFYVNSEDKLDEAVERFLKALSITTNKPEKQKLIYSRINSDHRES